VKLLLTQTFRPGRRFVIGVPFVWLGIFFVVPFLILLRISITDMGNGIDPFAPLFDSSDGTWRWLFKFDNYAAIFRAAADGAGLVANGLGQTIYMDAYITSLKYAFFHNGFLSADRLPVCLFHCACPAQYSPGLADDGDAAVLDFVFVACLRLEGHSGGPGRDQQRLDGCGPH